MKNSKFNIQNPKAPFTFLKVFLSLIISVGFFSASVSVNAVYAQAFKFELSTPQSQIAVNQPVQVKILINTAGQQAINGDALFTFDPAAISVDAVATGNFFTYFSSSPLGGANNKYLVSSWEESVAHAKSSTSDTLFATIDFTLKASSATLTFDCTNGIESDSNINRASDSRDIIVCPLTPLTISVGGSPPATPSVTPVPSPTGGGGGETIPTSTPTITSTPTPSATPRPTSTPVPTNTSGPTVSELPRSGTMEVTIMGMGIGAFLFIAGLLLVAI